MRVWIGPIWCIRFGFGRGESDGCGGGGGGRVVGIDLMEVSFSFVSEVVVEDVAECCRRCICCC